MVSQKGMALKQIYHITYDIISGSTSKRSQVFQVVITALIVLNVVFVILETETAIREGNEAIFDWVENISLTVFVIEYATRLVVYKANPKFANRRFGILRLICSPLMLIDLAVILPFFLPFLGVDARIVRIVRLLRLFSVFKLARISVSMRLFGTVIREKMPDMVMSLFILFVLLTLASSLMYFLEKDEQPDKFSSIPSSMWWGVVTLTTIGYGDTVPVTPMGKLVAAGVAILGIAVFAIPAGIMASAFSDVRQKMQKKKFCSNCGEPL